ncbi:YdeI family protein [Bacteroidota bacterium]
MESIYCKNRDEWRAWLENNHAFTNEIWLIYYKKHTKKPTVVYDEAVEEALCFGWIDSTVKRIDEEIYMQKYTPRNDKSMWSLVNKKRVEKMIKEKKMTKAGLQKVEIAKKNGQWKKAYTSQQKIEIPEQLKNALKSNKTAWLNFNKFAPSYQNLYSGWVASAKKPKTIEKRISIVVERSEKNEKPGML